MVSMLRMSTRSSVRWSVTVGYAARNPYILFKKLKQHEHGEALLKFFLDFRVNWCVRDALLEVERSAPPGETPAPSPLRTADIGLPLWWTEIFRVEMKKWSRANIASCGHIRRCGVESEDVSSSSPSLHLDKLSCNFSERGASIGKHATEMTLSTRSTTLARKLIFTKGLLLVSNHVFAPIQKL